MSLYERWCDAEYAELTPTGRVVLTLLIIGFFLLPSAILGPIEITDMESGAGAVFLGNFVVTLLAILTIIVSIIVVFIVWMFGTWIFTGRSGLDSFSYILVDKMGSRIATFFRVFFGSYTNKWTFLYEFLYPDKVAAEALKE